MNYFIYSLVVGFCAWLIMKVVKPADIIVAKKFYWSNTFRAVEKYGTSRIVGKELCFRSLLQDKIQRKWSPYPCDTQLREKGIYVSLQVDSAQEYYIRLLIPWEAIKKCDTMTFSSLFLFFVTWRMRKRDYLMLTFNDTPIILYLPCDKIDVDDVLSKILPDALP